MPVLTINKVDGKAKQSFTLSPESVAFLEATAMCEQRPEEQADQAEVKRVALREFPRKKRA
jgi:hypothetical protein